MFINNINPVLFSIGSLDLRYYGIIYALGFVLTYYFLRNAVDTKRLRISYDTLDSFFIWLILGVILGSRILEVFVYGAPYYFSHPEQMIRIWDGGLSFHGGLIGAILVTILFCKKHKIKFYDFADLIVIPASLGLFFGRIANYINSELYGKITSVPWCVVFEKIDSYCRHPSQIYEAIYTITLFVILYFYDKKQQKSKNHIQGSVFWLFVILYGIFRFIVSFFRDEPIYLYLNMGQWLSLIMIILGVFFFFSKHKSKSI